MADFLKLIQTSQACSDCKNDNILNRLLINNSIFCTQHITYEVKLNKKIWKHFYKSHLPIEVYYKSRQSYYKLRRSVVQNITSFFMINYDKVLTNRARYYKLQ